MHFIRTVKVLIFIVLPALFLFWGASNSYAVTLFSEGFESGIGGWSSSGGSSTATQAADLVRTGTYSIKIQHDKTSSFGYQTVVQSIEPGMFYEISGYGRPGNANLNAYFLRVAWYASPDGTGSQLSQVNDSNSGSNADADWMKLTTNAIQAPSNANSAKVRLVLTSKTLGQLANAYFDDVAFAESIAPTSTPTQIPTVSPTNTPAPTKSPTASPTLSVVITSTTSSQTATPVLPSDILGSESADILLLEDTKTPTPSKTVEVLSASENMIPKILISIGGILLTSCGILAFKIYRKN